MCKILTFSNASKIKNQTKLINTAAKLLSAYEKDGFGYVAQGSQGIFGERTLSPKSFKSDFKTPNFEAPFVSPISNTFGVKTAMTGAALFHGRTSTNDKTLLNTHPINKHGWSLIHNGVVSNHGPKYEMLTTNDTEHVLEHLSSSGIEGLEKYLTGYYAVCALSPDGNLHVIRDDRAYLYCTFVESIDSFIFATTQDLIKDICKALSLTPSKIQMFKENVYAVLNGSQILSCVEFSPRGSTYEESKHAVASLGRSFESTSDKYDSLEYRAMADDLNKLNSDEEAFLREMSKFADETYTYQTFNGLELSYAQFMDLSDDEKLSCIVYRPDGSRCDGDDYQNYNRIVG